MERYNFAWVPLEGGEALVQLAQENYRAHTAGYLLNSVHSLPHISVCQIETEQPPSELLPLFHAITAGSLPLMVSFESKIELRNGQGNFAHLNWIELRPVASAMDSLQHIHNQARNVLCKFNLECKNKHGNAYRPHLTLANSLREDNEVHALAL